MEETSEPRVLQTEKPQRKLPLKWSDLAIFAVIIGVVTGMTTFIVHRTQLKHEVSAAKAITSQVVSALSKQDTIKLRSLGDKKFQTDNSAASLSAELTFKTTPPITFGAMYGDAKPVIDQALVLNNARGQHVTIVYRYDKLKVPFYVRIDTIKPPHDQKWHLQALGASTDTSTLFGATPAAGTSSI